MADPELKWVFMGASIYSNLSEELAEKFNQMLATPHAYYCALIDVSKGSDYQAKDFMAVVSDKDGWTVFPDGVHLADEFLPQKKQG